MKKILLLTKTLLAAVLLCVGQSAWAETINVNSTESAYVLKDSETNYDGTSNALVAYYTQYRNWGSNDGTANFRNASAKLVLYKFSLADFKSAEGSMTSATLTFTTTSTEDCYNIFAVGYKEDWSASTVTGKNLINNVGTITGVVTATGSFQPLGTGYAGLSNGKKATDISIDATTYVQSAIDAGLDYVSFAIGINIMRNLPLNTTAKLSGEFTAAAATKYTVKYQNAGGTDLKDAVEYDTFVGETFTASASDMATFYNGDSSKKYVYASGNTTPTAVADAASNVITLVFNEYDKIAYTVTAKDGETSLGTLSSGNAYTDGSTTVYWNKFKQFDGQWYATTGSYGKTITEAGNTDVAYTASDIAYFFEAENLNTSRSGFPTASGTGYSGGSARRNYASAQMWTSAIAEGGTFILTFPYSMANASESTIEIKTRDAEGNFTDTGLSLTASSAGTFSQEITIPAGSSVAITKDAYNSNILIDYLTLTPKVSATIGDAGWATLYTPYALNFSGITGLTAYTATCSDGTVTLTPVDNVPANTGVVLKGAADTYSIPVATSSTTAQGHLKGSATEATAYNAFDGYTLYVLTTVDNGNVQFNPVNEGLIAAGKAFLKVSGGSSSEARALRVVFDGVTGVDNVEAAAEAKAQDGKFIENGKIVIVKNGVKYNAAGQQVK